MNGLVNAIVAYYESFYWMLDFASCSYSHSDPTMDSLHEYNKEVKDSRHLPRSPLVVSLICVILDFVTGLCPLI